ncbi:hypothetical protein [Wenyingzhuangia sp. 2_MG-2023]|uniref:hypothetical protein n=1 Tax=Wenyingzhuangia sp. 2_MG-2023 TaxID=3062639 RepID=UPI0026E460DC|nr:hypothetical protein [Wenyingzhuangia sp. 2_MG-2023]MDO6737072.1 hypothetical protein [Wenyingzhuangia sp. 2_MG-2023]
MNRIEQLATGFSGGSEVIIICSEKDVKSFKNEIEEIYQNTPAILMVTNLVNTEHFFSFMHQGKHFYLVTDEHAPVFLKKMYSEKS